MRAFLPGGRPRDFELDESSVSSSSERLVLLKLSSASANCEVDNGFLNLPLGNGDSTTATCLGASVEAVGVEAVELESEGDELAAEATATGVVVVGLGRTIAPGVGF